ncbi:MAG: hypothetical protein JXA28_12290 [Bacteroidetes bacterium]|nr:hypothetical protein [Bacteroidota bacterium]
MIETALGHYAYRYDGAAFTLAGRMDYGGQAMGVTVNDRGIVFLASGNEGL